MTRLLRRLAATVLAVGVLATVTHFAPRAGERASDEVSTQELSNQQQQDVTLLLLLGAGARR